MLAADPITASLILAAELARNYRQAYETSTPEEQARLRQPMLDFLAFWHGVASALMPPSKEKPG